MATVYPDFLSMAPPPGQGDTAWVSNARNPAVYLRALVEQQQQLLAVNHDLAAQMAELLAAFDVVKTVLTLQYGAPPGDPSQLAQHLQASAQSNVPHIPYAPTETGLSSIRTYNFLNDAKGPHRPLAGGVIFNSGANSFNWAVKVQGTDSMSLPVLLPPSGQFKFPEGRQLVELQLSPGPTTPYDYFLFFF